MLPAGKAGELKLTEDVIYDRGNDISWKLLENILHEREFEEKQI
jgi:hypothetical protein